MLKKRFHLDGVQKIKIQRFQGRREQVKIIKYALENCFRWWCPSNNVKHKCLCVSGNLSDAIV